MVAKLKTIQGLDGLCNLKSLDLAFNLIKRIENIQNLTSLQHLDISNNLVYRLDDTSVLKMYVSRGNVGRSLV